MLNLIVIASAVVVLGAAVVPVPLPDMFPSPQPRPQPRKPAHDDEFDDDSDDTLVQMGPPHVDPAQPPPWSHGAPAPEDEIFSWSNEQQGTRSWVPAIAYREWQRWVTFVKQPDDPTSIHPDVLVPIHLDQFPRGVWNQVLEMCTKFGHRCELDSIVSDMDRLKRRCTFCFSDRTGPCTHVNPKRCAAEYCNRCLTRKQELLAVLAKQDRKVTARVKKAT